MDCWKRTLFGLLLVLVTTAGAAGTEFYSKTTLTEAGSSVTAIAFNPDGTKIARALDDASIRLKDTAGGEGTLLKWDGQPAYFVIFSPDGTRMAAATMDSGLGVWDV